MQFQQNNAQNVVKSPNLHTGTSMLYYNQEERRQVAGLLRTNSLIKLDKVKQKNYKGEIMNHKFKVDYER